MGRPSSASRILIVEAELVLAAKFVNLVEDAVFHVVRATCHVTTGTAGVSVDMPANVSEISEGDETTLST